MAQSLMYIGFCSACGAEAYFVGGSSLEWKGDKGRYETCVHKMIQGRKTEPNKGFPSENEAKYRKCLTYLQQKSEGYLKDFEARKSKLQYDLKEEIEKQFYTLETLLEERKVKLLKLANDKIEERTGAINETAQVLNQFWEKCDSAINEILGLIQT
ncbi:hypothetical protein RFI_23695 [Reticulomyxa filosa]|uniref:Uncharacterized protein n=1 Tax=Reticulomyxa filosa TaxID=46433 RepID=X6MI35_RETFI|nr:hypothetical protein RFI_23695 [Reticulomyxa filosa]|eukprot:ETO13673.1 hypothetical protein RFI_23695 [Reticulomyxa filosa]